MQVPAAKVHVLGLAPLKVLLGDRWERLSALVHKLFEKALRDAQSPDDQFVQLDELAYAATFARLSPSDANLMCRAIAEKICKALFGNEIDEVSVRSLVTEINRLVGEDAVDAGRRIEWTAELQGAETVTTKSKYSSGSGQMTVHEKRACRPLSALEQIKEAHTAVAKLGLRLGFFLVWELKKDSCNSLFLVPFHGTASHIDVSGRQALSGLGATDVASLEIVLLRAAAAYATRAHEANQLCAIGVGVCYETLSGFNARILYLTELQRLRIAPSTPLLVKIERIPRGAPMARIAEIVAMMKFPNIRIIVEFESLDTISEIGIRLGATGIGGAFTAGTSYEAAKTSAERLVRRAITQGAFTYLDRLDTAELSHAARDSNVRFGTGSALGTRHFIGLEAVPPFPLTREIAG